MTQEQFDKVFQEQTRRCESLLCNKAKEYAADFDRLHNFHVAEKFTSQRTPVAALAGMMLKHVVSLFDMMEAKEPLSFPSDLWDEKITDTMNYLFLLCTVLTDERQQEVNYDPNFRLIASPDVCDPDRDPPINRR